MPTNIFLNGKYVLTWKHQRHL